MPEAFAPTRVRAAQVRRPHGVRGEVRVIPLGGDLDRFHVGLELACEQVERVLSIASVRPLGDGDLLVTFEGVASREAAAALSGTYLCVEGEDARQLGPDEWFIHQLVGLRAVTASGDELGAVTEVEEYPAHDTLVVTGPGGERRFPMNRAFVERVDIGAGVVVLTPWEEA